MISHSDDTARDSGPADAVADQRGQGSAGLLGDTVARDYARKLHLFNRFAEPELRQAVATLALEPGMQVLDAGCGSGHSLEWLATAVGERGLAVGIDLASAHAAAARKNVAACVAVLQADLLRPPLAPAALIWSGRPTPSIICAIRSLDCSSSRACCAPEDASPWCKARCCRICTSPGMPVWNSV